MYNIYCEMKDVKKIICMLVKTLLVSVFLLEQGTHVQQFFLLYLNRR